jgi:hypothetical protein
VPNAFRDPWRAVAVYILLARMSLLVVALPLLGSRCARSRSPAIYRVGILDLLAERIVPASFLGSRFVSYATYRASPPLGVASGVHAATHHSRRVRRPVVMGNHARGKDRADGYQPWRFGREPHPDLGRLVVWTATRWLQLDGVSAARI